MTPQDPKRTPERVAAAVRMRATGATLRVIGAQFGVDHKTVAAWLKQAEDVAAAATDAVLVAAIRDHRAEAHSLLDQVVTGHVPQVGQVGNANVLLRSIEIRSRLEGLNPAPRPAGDGWAKQPPRVVIFNHATGARWDARTREPLPPMEIGR